MSKISASVGIHSGKQCYNVVADQETIIDLLNRIPTSSGGQGGALSGPVLWGVASHSLHEAILKFQRWNHLSVDGHIDPNGAALKAMDRLVSGSSGSGSSGSGSGTSEVGPSTPSSGPAGSGSSGLPICGPMRTVRSGSLLPASVDVQGGPTGQFIFRELIGLVTIETTVTSPTADVDIRTVSRTSPVGKLYDVGMPSPVHWALKIRAKTAIIGAVKWEFLTDWSPGDPPCTGR